jgi:hypothetical protein
MKLGNPPKNRKWGSEYRDTNFSSLEEFKESDIYKNGVKSEEHFLTRNYGGTYYLIDELSKYNLVDCDGESWHITYIVTEFGKEIINSHI